MSGYAAVTANSSLFHFTRAAALVMGFAVGAIGAGNQRNATVSSLKAGIAERDAKIADLEEKLSASERGSAPEAPSTGDPVQDWIAGLEK